MTKSKIILIIILEFAFGIVFGFLGSYIFLMSSNEGHLYSVRFSYIAMYLSSLIGIGIVGYFYLKEIERVNNFIISMLLSLFGLVIFYIILHLTVGLMVKQTLLTRATPTYLTFILLLLPIVGAIIGFNYKTRDIFRHEANIKV